MKMKEFSVGIHRVCIPKTDIALWLHVTKDERYTEPLRVLTNTSYSNAIEVYFNRWEIERVFKTIKQEFQLEKIGVMKLSVFKNIVAFIQLAMALSNACFNATSEGKALYEATDGTTE